jgi:hypothetical protein
VIYSPVVIQYDPYSELKPPPSISGGTGLTRIEGKIVHDVRSWTPTNLDQSAVISGDGFVENLNQAAA